MTAHRMNLSVRETMSLVAEPASGGGVQSQRTTSTPYWIPSFVSLSVRERAKSRQQKQRSALWMTEEAMAWFVCSRAAGTLRRRRRPRRGMAGFLHNSVQPDVSLFGSSVEVILRSLHSILSDKTCGAFCSYGTCLYHCLTIKRTRYHHSSRPSSSYRLPLWCLGWTLVLALLCVVEGPLF